MSESERFTGWRGTDEGRIEVDVRLEFGGNGTDDFGFSALPGGYRARHGYFVNAGYGGYWWSSSPSGGDAWYRSLLTAIQTSTGHDIRVSASRSGVLGMPIERSEGGLTL